MDEMEKFYKREYLKEKVKKLQTTLVASIVTATCWFLDVCLEVIFPKSTINLVIYCILFAMFFVVAICTKLKIKEIKKEISNII